MKNGSMAKDACCSYCGGRFPDTRVWPRPCQLCGNTTYRNPLPVAVVLVPAGEGLVVIRRNTEPRKGTLTFPGGYIDMGERWQQAARRELLEETGMDIPEEELSLYDVDSGLDDTLVITGLASPRPETALKPFSSDETQEVTIIRQAVPLGFPLHTKLALRWFREKSAGTENDKTTS